MLTVALETIVYLGVGLVIMMLGYFIIDLVIPVDFPQEIREGNKAVGSGLSSVLPSFPIRWVRQ